MIRILTSLSKIPLGSTVSRIAETNKTYIVRDAANVYTEEGLPYKIQAGKNCFFLTDTSDTARLVLSGDTEVIWDTEESSLLETLGMLPYAETFASTRVTRGPKTLEELNCSDLFVGRRELKDLMFYCQKNNIAPHNKEIRKWTSESSTNKIDGYDPFAIPREDAIAIKLATCIIETGAVNADIANTLLLFRIAYSDEWSVAKMALKSVLDLCRTKKIGLDHDVMKKWLLITDTVPLTSEESFYVPKEEAVSLSRLTELLKSEDMTENHSRVIADLRTSAGDY